MRVAAVSRRPSHCRAARHASCCVARRHRPRARPRGRAAVRSCACLISPGFALRRRARRRPPAHRRGRLACAPLRWPAARSGTARSVACWSRCCRRRQVAHRDRALRRRRALIVLRRRHRHRVQLPRPGHERPGSSETAAPTSPGPHGRMTTRRLALAVAVLAAASAALMLAAPAAAQSLTLDLATSRATPAASCSCWC